MNALDQEAIELAAAVVAYAQDKALSLGGLVDRIKSEGRLTQETADAVIEYCNDHSLGLGGLVDIIARFHNDLNDLASYAREVKSVAGEYIDEQYDDLTDVQKACLVEITTSLSVSNARIIELWNASGLTY